MNFPGDVLYHPEHMWLRVADGTIGITDFAQDQLGPLLYVQLPELGEQITQGESLGQIEAEKSLVDLYSPINGTVTAVNTDFFDDPEVTNRDPYGAGWLLRVDPASISGVEALLHAAAYEGLTQK